MDNQDQREIIKRMLDGSSNSIPLIESFKPKGYKGPTSYLEGIELVKRNKGLSLEQIPFDERYSYAVIELILPSMGQPLGVQEQRRLIAKAKSWEGFHIQYPNEKGVMVSKRLDDDNPQVFQVVFNLPHIPELETHLRSMDSQVFEFVVIADAVTQFVELEMMNRKVAYQNNLLNLQASGVTIQDDTEYDDTFKGLSLANVYLDMGSIKPTAGLSYINPEDVDKIEYLLNQSANSSQKSYRKARVQNIKANLLLTPTTSQQVMGVNEQDVDI